MTVPEAYGNNNVTDEVTPSVAADKVMRFHSGLETSQRRRRESVETGAAVAAVAVVVVLDGTFP